ncbi:hypothetical protein ACTXT7_015079 [Hymenolepis weldensis]
MIKLGDQLSQISTPPITRVLVSVAHMSCLCIPTRSRRYAFVICLLCSFLPTVSLPHLSLTLSSPLCGLVRYSPCLNPLP